MYELCETSQYHYYTSNAHMGISSRVTKEKGWRPEVQRGILKDKTWIEKK